MKITKSQLKQIIAEELQNMVENHELDEGILDRAGARFKGLGSKLKGWGAQKALQATGRGQAAKDVKKSQDRLAANKRISHIMRIKHRELQKLYTEMSKDLSILKVDQDEDVQRALTHLEAAMKGFEEIVGALTREMETVATTIAPTEEA